MRSCLIVTIVLAVALAKEHRNEVDKAKRDTSEDYHNEPGMANEHSHPGKAVSFAEVNIRAPPRYYSPATHPSHYPQAVAPHIAVGRVAMPIKVPTQYPVTLMKRVVPYLVNRHVQPISLHPSYQNFVITKVPLVYQASYGEPHQDFGHYAHPHVAVGRNYAEEHY